MMGFLRHETMPSSAGGRQARALAGDKGDAKHDRCGVAYLSTESKNSRGVMPANQSIRGHKFHLLVIR